MTDAGIPTANVRFSLFHNEINAPLLAAGSATEFPSFIEKQRMRCENHGFNIDSGFFAAMCMLDKRVEFRSIPHTYFKINDKDVHYVGEINHTFNETIIEGDVNSDRFIIWYIFGEEIVGFCTVGYTNLHLYLWEAMKLLIMPTATQVRRGHVTYKSIVTNVLKCRPEIEAKRKDIVKIPSQIIAEFTHETEKLDTFRRKLKANVAEENTK